MEYFQIADMFGRRRRPSLRLYLDEMHVRSRALAGGTSVWARTFMLGLKNNGRGIARFPSVRLQTEQLIVDEYGVDGNGFFGLHRLPADAGWIAFGGGADDVIYPGTVLKITKLDQRARLSQWQRAGVNARDYVFDEAMVTAEIFADDAEVRNEQITIPKSEHRDV
jgi:hypothetical protein